MKFQFKGLIAGIIIGATIASGVTVAAANTTTLYNVLTEGIKIVIDGKEFTATDANGTVVQPMIYNGTTYLPVRAVANAFDKAVYWDGAETTVYLGKMDGKLEKPSATFIDLNNIAGSNEYFKQYKNISDIRGNFYNNAYKVGNWANTKDCCEYLLNKKYSKFKATIFVEEGSNWSETVNFSIIGDEKVLFNSDDVTKITKKTDAFEIEVDITDVDDFKIIFSDRQKIYIAHEGFYQ